MFNTDEMTPLRQTMIAATAAFLMTLTMLGVGFLVLLIGSLIMSPVTLTPLACAMFLTLTVLGSAGLTPFVLGAMRRPQGGADAGTAKARAK